MPFLKKLSPHSDLVIDFETTGLDVLDKDFRTVGIALASDKFPQGIYVPIDDSEDSDTLLKLLSNYNLIAHNVSYDARVLELEYRRRNIYKPMEVFPWKNDTYLMFKALANEGYSGQKWSLKQAQIDVLGWKETNEKELDQWLIENGCLKRAVSEELLTRLYVDGQWCWEDLEPEEYHKVIKCADKGKMSCAPIEILGHYGALDAQSTWALYKHFSSYYDKFPDMEDILEKEMMVLAEFEVEQFFRGLHVDRDLLIARRDKIKITQKALLEAFFNNSEATPWIKRYNENIVNAIGISQPLMYTKTGKESVRWQKWQKKFEEASAIQHFNPNSKDQLAWLFYDCLYETTELSKTYGYHGVVTLEFTVTIDNVEYKLKGTPTGKRTVDKQILPKLGTAGRLLAKYNELTKLIGYMDGMIESLSGDTHHTNLRLYGTVTGRCSGTGGVNIQQLPKWHEYLDCLKPRPGHVFIQMDVDALEPVVLAELSEDPAMMNLYGPGAKPNDIYLYVGASIPALRDKVCAYGYDPLNPTQESINLTKQKAKKIRTICKVLHLSAGYGAGPFKIHETLTQSGIEISLEEVKEIHTAYWKLFEGVVKYQNFLKSEYKLNGGWFLNGRGMPVSVAARLEKDILNRCIQSTGHFNLLTYLKHLKTLRDSADFKINPIMVDFHDETIWEVKTEDAEKAIKLFKSVWELTNKDLGGIIPLSGTPEICYTFTDFKCEGPYKVDEIINEFSLEVA